MIPAGLDARSLLLGGAYVLLALASPRAALLVLIPVVALAPELTLGTIALRPDDLLLAILVAAWILQRLVTPRQPTALDRPLLVYFLVGLVGTMWGAATGTADLWSTSQITGSGLHVLKRLEFVLLFFLLTDVIRTVGQARRMVYVFMASLAALSAYSLQQFYATGRIALAPVGAAIHEPGLAAMLNVALALGLLVASRRVATTVMSGGVLLGSLWVLPFSLGRNFIWSTLAMLGLVGFSRKRSLLLLLPVGWLVAPALLPQSVLARALSIRYAFAPVRNLSVGAGVYVPDRLGSGFQYVWDVLTSSPLFGWGLASVSLGSVDSEYANQFVATGILGFLVFVWLAVRLYRMARETVKIARELDSPALPLATGLQYALLGYALYSLFSPSISAARAGAFFFIITGLVAVLHRHLLGERPPQPSGDPVSLGGAGGKVVGP